MKRMLSSFKEIFIYFLLLMFALLIYGCTPSSEPEATKSVTINTLEKVKKDKTLRVGYIIYPPTVQKDPNTGKLTGHYVDTIEEIAKLMNVKVEYHEADWSTFEAGLMTGQFDLSIAATYRTIPRAMAVSFLQDH